MSRIEDAIVAANTNGRLALAAFLTGGFPEKQQFEDVMAAVATSVDLLEIGIPFSDPMADGVSIQYSSHKALQQGVTLGWVLDVVEAHESQVPIILMSYLNPLLAFGMERLAQTAARVGVAGFIVPDLPYEEAHSIHKTLKDQGVDLIQLVTPATPPERLKKICELSDGFIYAVTITGTTGGAVPGRHDTGNYLDQVRRVSARPVMAGFGIRTPDHIRELAGHVNGVIVGSAIIDALRNNEDPGPFIQALRDATNVGTEVSQ